MTNFRLHNEQMVNGLRKIAWASVFHLMSPCLHVWMSSCLHASMPPCLHFSMFPCLHVYVSMFQCLYIHVSTSPCPYLYVSGIPQMENRTNGKRQLYFVCCNKKRKWQPSIWLLQTETEQKFFFLGPQMNLLGPPWSSLLLNMKRQDGGKGPAHNPCSLEQWWPLILKFSSVLLDNKKSLFFCPGQCPFIYIRNLPYSVMQES